MLTEIACPTCGAPGLEAQQPHGYVVCKFCGSKFAQDERMACPKCEAINPVDSGFCKDCGEKLKRGCPACSFDNWAGADYCARCGRNLDGLDSMAERHARGFKGTLQQQRAAAGRIKSDEEVASQKRLGAMWEVELRRQQNLAGQQAENKRQGTILLLVVVVIAVVVLGIMISVIAISAQP